MTVQITQFVSDSTGQAPLTAPLDLPQIQIRRIDTQLIVQTFVDMVEVGDGNYSYEFTPVATLDYTFQIDADPNAGGQALPRYFGGSFSGRADAAVLTDIPHIEAMATKSRFFIDNVVYDANGFPTSLRLRLFPTAALAAAATDGVTGEGETKISLVAGTPDATETLQPATVRGVEQ